MVENVKGQKISCSWERHQNKKLIGKQIGTSSKREHAKSKCKAQQDKCTGIIEYGPNSFAVSRNNKKEHVGTILKDSSEIQLSIFSMRLQNCTIVRINEILSERENFI